MCLVFEGLICIFNRNFIFGKPKLFLGDDSRKL